MYDMDGDDDRLALFEPHRAHLQAVATRLLGGRSDAEDAVQETWMRFARVDPADIDNVGGWLTTVVSRICFNVLRSRRTPTFPLDNEPTIGASPASSGGLEPETEAIVADSVAGALLVVLDTLSPPERLAFVLHDVFGVPFIEIAEILDRTPDAARKLASRARQRVQHGRVPAATSQIDPDQQRVVDAFLAAARGGDLVALMSLLDPSVKLFVNRAINEDPVAVGVERVTRSATAFPDNAASTVAAIIDGTYGAVLVADGHAVAAMQITTSGGVIVEIDIVNLPDLMDALTITVLDTPA